MFQVNYMEGIHLDFEQLTSWMKFTNVDDYQKYLGRLRGIPARVCALLQYYFISVDTVRYN